MDDSDDERRCRLRRIRIIVAIAIASGIQRQGLPSNRTLSGLQYVIDLLDCGNDVRIKRQLRIKLVTFTSLCDWLVRYGGLQGSRYMAVEEKLIVFIYITSQGVSNRLAQERFDQGSGSISRLVLLVIII